MVNTISLLAKLFIKERESVKNPKVRQGYGMLCSMVGICLNIMLFAGKFFAGSLTGSVAITADAFNNLSDAGSSIITLIGFKFAGTKPDESHPFGHGRIEYLSGLIVSIAILLMGIELFKNSIDKILHPDSVLVSGVAFGVLLASVMVKLYMAFYNTAISIKIDSSAMKATAMDSFSDCIATSVVLICMVIMRFTGINLDGIGGLLVAVFILGAGYGAAKDTLTPLLGQAPEEGFVKQIEEIVLSYRPIVGIHDLVVHDYGPGRVMISLHAEVPGNRDIFELHDVIDLAERKLKEELLCDAVIHMDPVVVDNKIVDELKEEMLEIVKGIDDRITIHDFRMVQGPTHTNVIFDAVVPRNIEVSDDEILSQIERKITQLSDNYFAVITIDKPYVKKSGL